MLFRSNYATGDAHNVKPKDVDQKKWPLGDFEYKKAPKDVEGIPNHSVLDPSNNKDKNKVATARTKRAAFLSQFMQNHAKVIVPGNPKLKIGSVVTLEIPSKSDNGGKEKQLSGKFLIVSIKHMIRPLGQTPRYLMELGVAKAGFESQGNQDG